MKMNVLQEPITKGISIIVVSMNRTSYLTQTIPSWKKALSKVKDPWEIVVLDWGSTIPIMNIWGIKLIRITKKYWHLSLAYNVASQFSRYDKILKLDADSLLSHDFFEKNEISRDCFVTGDWRLARNANETHINGVVFLDRDLFFKISGFNELIFTYGYDDTDLYERASEFSTRKSLAMDTVYHIPHSDELRGCNDIQRSIFSNMLLSHKYKWEGPMTVITRIKRTDPIRIQIQDTFKYISEEIIHSYKHFNFTMRFLTREALSPILFPSLRRKRLYIEVVNGLCNRLRSLASAAVIACSTNRDLVLVWIPSNHCEARYTDLFEVEPLLDLPVGFILSEDRFNSSHEQIASNSSQEIFDDNEQGDAYLITANVISSKYTNWNKESEFVRIYIKPVKELRVEIDNFGDVSGHIGVHIRMGQFADYDSTEGWTSKAKSSWEKWRKNSDYTIFSKCITKILEENPSQRFFLAADSSNVYDELIKSFGNNIDFMKRDVFDRSSKQIRYAVVDLFVLSKTRLLLGSNWSTFTELVQKLGKKKTYLAGLDFGI
jgi:hypothetical protein